MSTVHEALWVEKYRPQTIDQCILPEESKAMFNSFIEAGDIPNMILCGHQGMGKAQPLTSHLLKADGSWIQMKDVVVGDMLIDMYGRPTKVVGVFPQGIRSVYRLYFNDNSYIEVSDHHINTLLYRNQSTGEIQRLDIETKDLVDIDLEDAQERLKFWVPTPCITFQYQQTGNEMHWYRTGLLLGGWSNKLNKVEKRKLLQDQILTFDIHKLSVSQRVMLLRGIYSSVGIDVGCNYVYCTDDYQYQQYMLSQLDPAVAKIVVDVARTLGLVASSYQSEYNNVQLDSVIINCNKDCTIFSKKQYVKINKIDHFTRRMLVHIEKVEDQPCQCIKVDSSSSTYITDNYTVTHNTTVAKAITKQLGYETMFINASLENGIDVLRNKITQFASSISLMGNKKCVILDESDYANPQSLQPALRGFIEQFSGNVRFIFTCNYVNRIIPAIHSRCTVIDFNPKQNEKNDLIEQTLKRVFHILQCENVKFDPKVVAKLVVNHFPDIRRCVNELQRYSATGMIDEGIFVNIDHDNYNNLVQFIKNRDFKNMRQWLGNNKDVSPEKLFNYFYTNGSKFIEDSSIPQMVLTTAEYQYKSAFVVDQEINNCAYLTEIMLNCEMKNQ